MWPFFNCWWSAHIGSRAGKHLHTVDVLLYRYLFCLHNQCDILELENWIILLEYADGYLAIEKYCYPAINKNICLKIVFYITDEYVECEYCIKQEFWLYWCVIDSKYSQFNVKRSTCLLVIQIRN